MRKQEHRGLREGDGTYHSPVPSPAIIRATWHPTGRKWAVPVAIIPKQQLQEQSLSQLRLFFP